MNPLIPALTWILVGLTASTRAMRSPTATADTTVAASRGDELVLETHTGSVVVRVWQRHEIRVEGTGRPALARQGPRWILSDARAGGGERVGELWLTVPAWIDLSMEGRSLDVDVEGSAGRVEIGTTSGDVRLSATSGDVRVHVISGEIEAEGISGRADLSTVSGDIRVSAATGDLRLASVDGDFTLVALDVDQLLAETTDGDIDFEGRVAEHANLALSTHDGDITAVVPEGTDARVSVSTFDGAFEAGFPVRASGLRSGEAVTFVLGRGGGVLRLQAFDGDIRLRHPGSG